MRNEDLVPIDLLLPWSAGWLDRESCEQLDGER